MVSKVPIRPTSMAEAFINVDMSFIPVVVVVAKCGGIHDKADATGLTYWGRMAVYYRIMTPDGPRPPYDSLRFCLWAEGGMVRRNTEPPPSYHDSAPKARRTGRRRAGRPSASIDLAEDLFHLDQPLAYPGFPD